MGKKSSQEAAAVLQVRGNGGGMERKQTDRRPAKELEVILLGL